jgi:tetratricopeptide (TPR) repeat protein
MNRANKFFLLLAGLLTLAANALGGPAVDYYNRGVARQAIGDLDGAKADCSKALALKPDFADAKKALDELKRK